MSEAWKSVAPGFRAPGTLCFQHCDPALLLGQPFCNNCPLAVLPRLKEGVMGEDEAAKNRKHDTGDRRNGVLMTLRKFHAR
jgi:hypothetical protein